ncbi:hypothetical protein ARMSODRAFT_1040313 [Armillaria solidipes]|uniref:Aminoglycoside phosphotransferase domain-containing protein n=1 Tax=Armillaria solidipes TaxID=1076256 RepID=A0A2H3BCJ8_9AGAR|nr:hypothetical protein ARMSODRAFT_1040313 [Armillaria solidipes]
MKKIRHKWREERKVADIVYQREIWSSHSCRCACHSPFPIGYGHESSVTSKGHIKGTCEGIRAWTVKKISTSMKVVEEPNKKLQISSLLRKMRPLRIMTVFKGLRQETRIQISKLDSERWQTQSTRLEGPKDHVRKVTERIATRASSSSLTLWDDSIKIDANTFITHTGRVDFGRIASIGFDAVVKSMGTIEGVTIDSVWEQLSLRTFDWNPQLCLFQALLGTLRSVIINRLLEVVMQIYDSLIEESKIADPRSDDHKPLVFTHQDLHARNSIVRKDGKLWVIDWADAEFYLEWFQGDNMKQLSRQQGNSGS